MDERAGSEELSRAMRLVKKGREVAKKRESEAVAEGRWYHRGRAAAFEEIELALSMQSGMTELEMVVALGGDVPTPEEWRRYREGSA